MCVAAAAANFSFPAGQAIQEADLLSRWAFNQMLIGVATRKYARSVRLPDGDLAGQAKRATTKSSVSRRFVALSTTKLKEWLAADLSGLAAGNPDRQAEKSFRRLKAHKQLPFLRAALLRHQ